MGLRGYRSVNTVAQSGSACHWQIREPKGWPRM
jgi:hypothetical protein